MTSAVRHAMAGLLLIGLCVSGCEKRTAEHTLPSINTAPATSAWTKTELYFGLSTPDGVVSMEEWQAFLAADVTPDFKQGLTVIEGDGQFLNRDGKLVKEKSRILILIHESTPEKKAAIARIVETYKRRFRQESVLRVTSAVGVEF